MYFVVSSQYVATKAKFHNIVFSHELNLLNSEDKFSILGIEHTKILMADDYHGQLIQQIFRFRTQI